MGANDLNNFSVGWYNAQCCESAGVDHYFTVHEHLVLAVPSMDHIDIDRQITSELRRHTGGVQARQSIRTITNSNSGHFGFLLARRPTVA